MVNDLLKRSSFSWRMRSGIRTRFFDTLRHVVAIDDTRDLLVYAGQGGDMHALDISQKNRVLAKFKASPGW